MTIDHESSRTHISNPAGAMTTTPSEPKGTQSLDVSGVTSSTSPDNATIDPVIETIDLSVFYGEYEAVRDVDMVFGQNSSHLVDNSGSVASHQFHRDRRERCHDLRAVAVMLHDDGQTALIQIA